MITNILMKKNKETGIVVKAAYLTRCGISTQGILSNQRVIKNWNFDHKSTYKIKKTLQ